MLKLTLQEFQKIDQILERIYTLQETALRTYEASGLDDEEMRAFTSYSYYQGNLGFIKWLRWFLDPNKMQAKKGRLSKRHEPTSTTPSGSTGVG